MNDDTILPLLIIGFITYVIVSRICDTIDNYNQRDDEDNKE